MPQFEMPEMHQASQRGRAPSVRSGSRQDPWWRRRPAARPFHL